MTIDLFLVYFFAAGFGIIFGFLVLCFPAFLLFAFPSSLPVCLSALPASFHSFLLPCFPCFSAFVLYLLLFFSASLLSLLFCFCASVPFYFYYSTFSFFRHVFLLLYFLLLCFSASCLYCLSVFSFLLLYSLLFVNTLGETQRNLKEILIRTPDKKPYMKP